MVLVETKLFLTSTSTNRGFLSHIYPFWTIHTLILGNYSLLHFLTRLKKKKSLTWPGTRWEKRNISTLLICNSWGCPYSHLILPHYRSPWLAHDCLEGRVVDDLILKYHVADGSICWESLLEIFSGIKESMVCVREILLASKESSFWWKTGQGTKTRIFVLHIVRAGRFGW